MNVEDRQVGTDAIRDHKTSCPGLDELPVDIDTICCQHADALHNGHPVAIEDWLCDWQEPERSKLLCELIRTEAAVLRSQGCVRQAEEWQQRFPDDQLVVTEALAETLGVETIAETANQETIAFESELTNLRFLERGGLGVVYLAEESRLKRDTAVKFIREDLVSDEASKEQFLLEAEVTGRLDHPGIPAVHGLGQTPTGQLFYSMKFIKGQTLAAAIDDYYRGQMSAKSHSESRVRFRELLQQFVAVCQTVAYAHRRGIVHRDLKPANIIRGRYGETMVIDWGLAIPVGRRGVFKDSLEQTLTPGTGKKQGGQSKACVGTPAYMSPEQASGQSSLGPASDIYSLGATLYSILTGTLPFRSSDVKEIRSAVIEGRFERPMGLNRRIAPALEAICLKAMATRADDRYETAQDLARDVERFLADSPVAAYPESTARRFARWSRRHLVYVFAASTMMLLIAIMASGSALVTGHSLIKEKELHAREAAAREREALLRRESLQMAAGFAARTIGNRIEVYYRSLEREAENPALVRLLGEAADSAADEGASRDLQDLLDARIDAAYSGLPVRSWFVCDQHGTTLARFPEHMPDGSVAQSIGNNYNYRDYFHGLGQDLPPTAAVTTRPLGKPHNSTALLSTIDENLVVSFSVPVSEPETGESIGVLAISVQCGAFADLKVGMAEGQHVVLVETRDYRVAHPTSGASMWASGLVLHHDSLTEDGRTELVRYPDRIVRHLKQPPSPTAESTDTARARTLRPQLLPKDADYFDPVVESDPDSASRWLAAYQPVFIDSRKDPEVRDTGWVVIVQQRLRGEEGKVGELLENSR